MDTTKVHIIDGNSERRAELFGIFHAMGYRPEIYEDIPEFHHNCRSEGIIFTYDSSISTDAYDMEVWISKIAVHLPIILYSDALNIERAVCAMRSGALDYLHWPFTDANFPGKLRDIQARSLVWYDERSLEIEARNLVQSLSRRERQVIRNLVDGGSNRAIGEALEISSRTVEIHRANAFRKLGAKSTADAVRIGLLAGLQPKTARQDRQQSPYDLGTGLGEILVRDNPRNLPVQSGVDAAGGG